MEWLNSTFQFNFPVQVIFGNGELSRLPEVVRKLGERVLVVTTKEIGEIGITAKAQGYLEQTGLSVMIYDNVKPDPMSTAIDQADLTVREFSPQVLIGLGGGSAMDFAKALAVSLTHRGPIWDYVNLSNRPPKPVTSDTLPIVSIPTTAGTGSEVTPYSVLINPETSQKATMKSPFIFSRTAIIDPELTRTMPPSLTAATGVDAFVHALESFINVKFSSPFSELMASEAMRIIPSQLPRALKNPDDLEARDQLAWASMLAGIAISHSGTTVIHALAQPLSARTGLPHSLTVAIFTPPIVRYTFQQAAPRFARIAEFIDPDVVKNLTTEEKARKSAELIEQFLGNVGMLHKISEYEIGEEVIEELVGDATTYMARPLDQHPVRFGEKEIRRICQEAYK